MFVFEFIDTDELSVESTENLQLYNQAVIIVIVYDKSKFPNHYSVPQYLHFAKKFAADNAKIILVGNCKDKRREEVTFSEGLDLAELNDLMFYEIGASIPTSVGNLFQKFFTIIDNKFENEELTDIFSEIDFKEALIHKLAHPFKFNRFYLYIDHWFSKVCRAYQKH
ncbi:Ras-related protein Rab-4B [Thelohanellus kitauei]|uniref:Ras-related protein Rab-4B n=1 Tax=Thelohanellus kitauei TaxID=669202 RepID=A0A0C2MNX2_THEKT|nr:Ras-related protein Rab-4B [Thelohanellus kitauei]